jgi:ribonucleoside-diphosphate reductase beta chain
VIGAPRDTWRSVLEGGVDPILGLLQGKLKLERGNLLKLVPYARAAKVLLSAAGRVPGVSPQAAAEGAEGAEDAGDVGTNGAVRAPRERAPLSRALDGSLVPTKLWRAAKKQGTWDPGEIDLRKDREDWPHLTGPERDLLVRLAVLFRGGERVVGTNLLPLMSVIASEGRIEEEAYLTSLLWEEAKHAELFDRFLSELAGTGADHASFETAAWRRMFGELLPADMQALRTDATPRAQVRAAVTCHFVAEGILAETGYHAFHLILERRGILPGMQRAIQYIRRDESRHLAWGQYLIGRLVAEHGDLIWKLAESRLAELLEPSLDVVREVFAAYDMMPFDLAIETLTDFAMTAFRSRLSKLEITRHMKLHDLVHSDID